MVRKYKDYNILFISKGLLFYYFAQVNYEQRRFIVHRAFRLNRERVNHLKHFYSPLNKIDLPVSNLARLVFYLKKQGFRSFDVLSEDY